MHKRNGRNRGFTLIEILIVVVILGILAAIVIPQFSSAAADANANAAASTAQTLQAQVEMFNFDEGTYPTAAEFPAILVTNGYLSATPVEPDGWDFTYDAATGRVTATVE